MPSIYQSRRPRASPLWQLVHHGWGAFSSDYEKKRRSTLGPLHPSVIATVESFLRCGDLASGFTRLECTDCGYERLLAFTCKTRHFCLAPDGRFHCLPQGAIGSMTELFRHRFSLQKITWNASTQTVIYRSKRHHNTKGLGQK